MQSIICSSFFPSIYWQVKQMTKTFASSLIRASFFFLPDDDENRWLQFAHPIKRKLLFRRLLLLSNFFQGTLSFSDFCLTDYKSRTKYFVNYLLTTSSYRGLPTIVKFIIIMILYTLWNNDYSFKTKFFKWLLKICPICL